MEMPDLLSISEAADELDLSPRRVRALVEAGKLKADRIGSRYALSRSELSRYQRLKAPGGRPLSSANAWALLALLDGERPSWLGPSAEWRLRRMLDQGADRVKDALLNSAPRSHLHDWRVLPRDLAKLLRDGDDNSGFVLSGLAAQHPSIDVPYLAEEDPIDAYVSERNLVGLRRRFKPSEDSARPNLRLRVPLHPWVLSYRRIAPAAVAAADLLEHDEARVVRAGQQVLEGLIDAHRDS
jgi:excisionase family DNA binding protein